ncbi:unnamed protein product [Meganyctiphanes norvegica]|uniref:Tyr recombinase domain-containing protein n=1 Tax=Meganyctiphanes norvegica TaxID=48144 RepID=A0AAV2SEH3_MEGNR
MHLNNLFTIVKVPTTSPLFTYNRLHSHSKHSLIRLLDQVVFKAGLPLADYSWHSFRRGAAVFAFELGLADSAVQLLGDWSSSAFTQYLEFAFTRKASVAKKKKIAENFDLHVQTL